MHYDLQILIDEGGQIGQGSAPTVFG